MCSSDLLRNLELKAEYLPNYIETGKQLQQLVGTKKKKKGGAKVKESNKGKEEDSAEGKDKDIKLTVTKDAGEANDVENELEYE